MTQLPTPHPSAFPMPISPDQAIAYSEGMWDEVATESAIRRYWRILFKHRWIVLGVIGACLALALIVSMLSQRQYTATVRVQVAREAAKVVDMNQVDEEQSSGSSMEFYQTQYALLKSRSLSEAVVRDLGLANDNLYLANYDNGKIDDVTAMPIKARLELATSMVNQNTTVRPVRGSSIIDVDFESPNRVVSSRVANSIAQNFIESSLSRRFEAAAYAREFLQTRLNQVRVKLEESERKAVEYAQREGLIRIGSGSGDTRTEHSLVSSDLAELSSQLTVARAQRALAEAQFRSGQSGNVAAQSLTNTTINALRQQRAGLLGQLSKLKSDFGPEYPTVVALSSQIAELDSQIGVEQSRVSSSVALNLGGRYDQALATERALQSRVDGLKSQLLGEQGRSIRFNILQRDVDTNRGLYEALLQRFKEVGIAGGVGTNNVSIVDSALPPKRPSSPNIPLNLALGLLIGLVLGGGAAIVLEQLAESVILPGEFQSKLRVPLLGSTPAVGGVGRPRLLGSRDSANAVRPANFVDSDPDLAEAYFSILTAVQFSTANGAPRTMAVTSSQASEGKSTTSLSLARGLATVGKRVLLIDGDMRNPSLHRDFGIAPGQGLSEVLTGQARLHDVLHSTAISSLSFVSAGKIPPNPAELLAGDGLGRTIRVAAEMFDHVIFDSPPVLGLADAPLIARATEGTIFVIQAGRTRSSQARQALDRLLGVRATILGAVLTQLDSRSFGYDSGYTYNYRYGAS